MKIKRNFYFSLLFVIALTTLSSCLSRPERIRTNFPSSSKPVSGNVIEKYANVIGVNASELKNKDLYKYIDEWMGIPHRLGGQNKGGIDCSAFANNLIQQVYGKNLPRTANDMAQVIKRKY